MKNKIKKIDILNNIKNKINVCLEYQKNDIDVLAEQRIKNAENNLCSNNYYVNVTLNEPEKIYNEDFSNRLKLKESEKHLLNLIEFDNIYEIGCVIIVSLKDSLKLEFDVKECNSFSNLFNILIEKYFNNDCILKNIDFKKSQLIENYIEDDISMLKNSGKHNLIYSLARFNKKEIERIIKSNIDIENYDLLNYSIEKLEEVQYVDMEKTTAVEQNINQFFKFPKILNKITLFNEKNKIPNPKLKESYFIFDIGNYVNLTLNEIKTCDNIQAKKKYNLYSTNIFKKITDSKYDMYKILGGDESWKNWEYIQNQFLYFKVNLSNDKNFLNDDNNKNFLNNLYIYEKTNNVFSGVNEKCITNSWNGETNIFKKLKPKNIIFKNNYSNKLKSESLKIIEKFLVDPPSIVIKSNENTKIDFDNDIKYDFSLSIPSDSDSDTLFISNSKLKMKTISGYFISNNKIYINRNFIILDDVEYYYTNNSISLNNDFYYDDLNNKKLSSIPEKSFYNDVLKRTFKSKDLGKRIIQSTINYSFIPKKIVLFSKFIQHSKNKDKEILKDIVKNLKIKYKSKYKRIVIDTINYDPWENIIKKLENLYFEWNKLNCVDKDGFFIFLNNETNVKDLKLCLKYYPIIIHGINNSLKSEIPLYYLNTYIYDYENNKLTNKQILKYICNTINLNLNDYDNDEKIKKILEISYEDILNSRSINKDQYILNQLSYVDFENFKKEYSNKNISFNEINRNKFIKKIPAGLMNGYLYIPTGYDIIFNYDVKLDKLIVNGTTSAITDKFSKLECESFNDYVNNLNILLNDNNYEKISVLDDLKKFIVFPHLPSIKSILNGNEISKNDIIYKIDFYDFKNLKDNIKNKKIFPIHFSIYIKKMIKCRISKM